MLKWLWLSALVVVLDQASKLGAEHWLQYHIPVMVMPGFNWMLTYNTGAAFSFLSDAGGWQRWFFSALALIVSAVLIVWLRRLTRAQIWLAVGLAMIVGGALGNVVDRLLYGHVIDFIQWYYDRWYWPAFNLADSAISVGAALVIIDALFLQERERPAHE